MPTPGHLATFLGTAPGVGKTFSMLGEAHRRATGGETVVVGWFEDHDRAETLAQLSGLEIVPPVMVAYRDHWFPEMDTATIRARNPGVVVVDELAHSSPDGSRKRWVDVQELLEAGADVLTSVNVANLLSARDYAARITGAGSIESVPDEFIRSGEVILIDLPPVALRTRLSAGKVFSAEQVGGALSEYFRIANLEALSELGQGWLEESIQRVGEDLLARRGIAPLNSRSIVMAGVSESSWGEAVIVRTAQLACEEDSDLLVIHVNVADGLPTRHPELLVYYRQLTEGLGGTYMEVDGQSPAQVLAHRAAESPVSSLVVARHRSGLSEILHGSMSRKLKRLLPDLALEEVHQKNAMPSENG